MRFLKIYLLTFQHVFEYRGRILVWFLMSLLNPLLLLLFWGGLTSGNKPIVAGWDISIISSYYLLVTLFDSMILCHIEEDVAREDVQMGNLATYLLKPISYYWKKFSEEFPYRIVQGSYALLLIFCMMFLIKHFAFTHSILILFLGVISVCVGLFLSFTFKMVLGLFSIWLIEVQGIYQFYDILTFVFGGYIIPLFLLPKQMVLIAYFLPFSYVVYMPVSIFQGRFSVTESIFAILGQIAWLSLFIVLYKYTWKKGLKKFTGVGR